MLSLTASSRQNEPATWVVCARYFCDIHVYIYIYFLKRNVLAQMYKNETYFPLQFIDLKVIWLAQRYTIISSLR